MMLRGEFRYDSARHQYAVGSQPIPGITAVLRWGTTASGFWFAESALARGRAVHHSALLHDMGDDVPELPESWLPYFSAYLAFRAAVPVRWREVEQPRLCRRLGFAGTPDRIGLVRGHPAIVELKTGYPAPFHGPQLAAQSLLLGRRAVAHRRLALYLQKDGRFRLVEHDDPRDALTFLTLLRDYQEAHVGEAEDGDECYCD